jgi:hypothetical protein
MLLSLLSLLFRAVLCCFMLFPWHSYGCAKQHDLQIRSIQVILIGQTRAMTHYWGAKKRAQFLRVGAKFASKNNGLQKKVDIPRPAHHVRSATQATIRSSAETGDYDYAPSDLCWILCWIRP